MFESLNILEQRFVSSVMDSPASAGSLVEAVLWSGLGLTVGFCVIYAFIEARRLKRRTSDYSERFLLLPEWAELVARGILTPDQAKLLQGDALRVEGYSRDVR